MLNITELRIKKMEDTDNLLAYASICIDDSIVIDGIKLLTRDNERYISMPIKRLKDKRIRNYAYPIKQEVREQLLDMISEEYDRVIEE